MNITHTITVLELIWTVAAVIGFAFDLALLNRSVVDYMLLKLSGTNGIRQYSAKTGIWVFVGGLVIQGSYIFIGAVAMYYPSPPGRIPLITWITGGVFISASVVATIIASVIYTRRVKLVGMIEERDDGE